MSFYDKERIKGLPTDMIKKATLITDIVKVGIDPDAIMRTHLSVTFFKGGGGLIHLHYLFRSFATYFTDENMRGFDFSIGRIVFIATYLQ